MKIKYYIIISLLIGIVFISSCGSSGTTSSATQTTTSENTQSQSSRDKYVEPKATQWYIYLVAQDISSKLKTTDAQLGELKGDEVVTKHTLKSLGSFGGSYLEIVFDNPDGVEEGEYKVNFHRYQEDTEDKWHFIVKTDSSHINDDIVLYFRGIYVLKENKSSQSSKAYSTYRTISNPLVKYMKIVDLDTHDEFPLVVKSHAYQYKFNMNGKQTRAFELVVEPKEIKFDKKINYKVVSYKKYINHNIQKVKVFDLNTPPTIKEGLSK